jgi:hypothetical protein
MQTDFARTCLKNTSCQWSAPDWKLIISSYIAFELEKPETKIMSRSVTRPRSKSAKAESASQGKPQRLPQSARYLRRAHAAVRAELGSAEPLPAFLAGAGRLTLSDRRRIVQQSLVLLEQNYVHLPLKKAMHAVEPVQRLRLNDLLMDNADLFAAAGDLLD